MILVLNILSCVKAHSVMMMTTRKLCWPNVDVLCSRPLGQSSATLTLNFDLLTFELKISTLLPWDMLTLIFNFVFNLEICRGQTDRQTENGQLTLMLQLVTVRMVT